MCKKYIYLVFITVFLNGCATPNLKGDLGTLSRKADAVLVGYSVEQMKGILGTPQSYFVSPTNPDISYAHYCLFGMFSVDPNGFFLYKDTVYKRVQTVTVKSRSGGAYITDKDVADWNCYADVRVDWARIPISSVFRADEIARQARAAEVAEQKETRAAEKKEQARLRASQLINKQYFIDGLIIDHFQDTAVNCVSGGFYQIKLKGSIGPDSSFAIEKLLKRSPNCLNENNEIVSRTSVVLNSLGGLLKDGYVMGRAFRTYDVKTVISSDDICASSCAVAYLGGVERVFEGNSRIMFHSPYLPGFNSRGQRTADCDIGTASTQNLLIYYQTMTSVEQGQRLMNRTMSYCSAEDGWVVKGYDAAELFGIATEI